MTDPRPRGARRVLITGGFGFLATWIAAGLLRGGHQVVLVDSRHTVEGSPAGLAGLPGLPGVRTVPGTDITRPGALDGITDVDTVVHAAALLGVGKVRDAPIETLRVNIDGTAAVLDYAVKLPSLRRFLLLSTSEVYGAEAKDAHEDEWLSVRVGDPRWSYAVSKVTAESMTAAYGTEHGLPFTIVRPFNVYGPLRTGSYAVGALCRQAVAGRDLTVHGDGGQTRAWCHAEDFANGVVRCLHAPEAEGETFNIGDDRFGLSVADLADRIAAAAGATGSVVRTPTPGPDIASRRPDLAKARRLVGHRPARGFDEGLKETVDWYRAGAGPLTIRLLRDDWERPADTTPGTAR
ncbi:MAG TPA: NAD-dependent epimerase/dehydratase family protein [Streptomyces sp.]|uniref:NAD-dependent epimerase/dehydratase family protein n=1 Tax=Streptomyces sp. TaxID=1931 RepID=UPI002D46E4F9|nr:NAD-dependent epimerase/dehydratase family protein [Streptomyces sp.]HZG04662.1 NAD-dependent epimerase/dehydratase family protein [Streptomyces sp.]